MWPRPTKQLRDCMTLLSRYEAGDFEALWQEIRLHARLDGEFRAEVLVVAETAMKRVARNADMLAERLSAYGWKPLAPEFTPLRAKPTEDDVGVFARIEEISGAPIPPTLLAFWKVVGGINLVWDYRSGSRFPISASHCLWRGWTRYASMRHLSSSTKSRNGRYTKTTKLSEFISPPMTSTRRT
jgi:hypothetical protein